MKLSFQKIFFVIAIGIGLFTTLILGNSVLVPLAFAMLTAFILFPVVKLVERWGANKSVAAFLAILFLILLFGGGIWLFSNQMMQMSGELTDFQDKILALAADVTLYINRNIGIVPDQQKGDLLEKFKDWLSNSAGTLMSKTVSGTASISFGLITAVVYTFLFLIYRNNLVNGLVHFYAQEQRAKAFNMLKSLQQVGQQYLFGMAVIILILGIVNSLGLWIIGIDNPILFGFLAAILALIPYAGTFLGAALPMLYAFISYDSLWLPIAIGIFFWAVQFVEANFLTPKIVGGKLHINALTSILSIIVGASVWGIAGMILFLPLSAMLKVFCDAHDQLKPLALLIGDNNQHSPKAENQLLGAWFRKAKSRLS
jgi:predicted PurR-regulated permease PerM